MLLFCVVFDISDYDVVFWIVWDTKLSVIVNCVVYNDVDGVEIDFVMVMNVNGLVVRWLVKVVSEIGVVFVYYGIDFVFDGDVNELYGELFFLGF